MEDLKKYLTVKQVAEKLDITEEWVRDLIKAKEIGERLSWSYKKKEYCKILRIKKWTNS